ncbi:hypothetical protein BDV97DRAFT_177014 [Delphinella strobiligena]|nr:hypothetical protein BDV97DRAFT_177014 [Delphinella strobiligena]
MRFIQKERPLLIQGTNQPRLSLPGIHYSKCQICAIFISRKRPLFSLILILLFPPSFSMSRYTTTLHVCGIMMRCGAFFLHHPSSSSLEISLLPPRLGNPLCTHQSKKAIIIMTMKRTMIMTAIAMLRCIFARGRGVCRLCDV